VKRQAGDPIFYYVNPNKPLGFFGALIFLAASWLCAVAIIVIVTELVTVALIVTANVTLLRCLVTTVVSQSEFHFVPQVPPLRAQSNFLCGRTISSGISPIRPTLSTTAASYRRKQRRSALVI
jgi:hypothetical protein